MIAGLSINVSRHDLARNKTDKFPMNVLQRDAISTYYFASGIYQDHIATYTLESEDV